MSEAVLSVEPLGFVWTTLDPFLFCVHHDDAYPAGNEEMGPRASLAGRHIGMDFDRKDGWSMYHGAVVPGFPRHPHRGFETVTVVRRGFVDHCDSLGAAGRYGNGDVQWMTAGSGIVHSEMFPLLDREGPNPTELFQIWLNLPKKNKMAQPHFSMFWGDTIPGGTFTDASGRATYVRTIAGRLADVDAPPPPPPSSWAADAESHVAIWTAKLEANATWTLPSGPSELNRMLYVFRGDRVRVAGQDVTPKQGARLRSDVEVALEAGAEECEVLMLQGRPIGEPVAHHGPFVMNTNAEISQAIADYQRTGYGGWPWSSDGPVHPRGEGRFAKNAE